jgi:cysteinyl-tRNA synthetase
VDGVAAYGDESKENDLETHFWIKRNETQTQKKIPLRFTLFAAERMNHKPQWELKATMGFERDNEQIETREPES